MISSEFEPYHYFSTPGYSWNATLKQDVIKSTIRSGVSLICKGFDEANNKFLKSYNANKPKSCIIYLDANNL